MRVLVTGGTGYIGSHIAIELITAGHEPYIVDSLENSSRDVLDAIEKIAGIKPYFLHANVRDHTKIARLLTEKKITAIIHCAGYKSVAESVASPLRYYENNVGTFVALLKTALDCDITSVIFSSSAAVYGNTPPGVVSEDTACRPESPYGWSKYMDEIILADVCTVNPTLSGTALRYFNVVGAHDSGLLGEQVKTEAQSLLPIIIDAVVGKRPPLTVYGTDYPTPDGTCLRDFIHVVDLAKAHVAALQHQTRGKTSGGYEVYNVGTGKPTSVLELITAFERVNDITVPYTLGERRSGDIVISYAACARAEKALNWHAEKTIDDAVRDSWRWAQNTAS